MSVPIEHYEHAWSVPGHTASDGGVLVRCGPPEDNGFYLICPAAATLYIWHGQGPVFFDCSLGPECDWPEVHRNATALMRQIVEGEGSKVCGDCLETKPIDEFRCYGIRATDSGRQYARLCRACEGRRRRLPPKGDR